jgi:exopolysaccharide production protein ExoQ
MPDTRRTLFQRVTLEDCACAAILAFFAMQGAVPFIAPNQALEVKNVPSTELTYWGGIASQLIVYGAICFIVCSDVRHIVRWLGAMRWTAALACLAVASSLWSQFPLVTLRRSVPFALAGLFGLCFAVKFPVRKQLSILWMAMIAVTLGTIVLVLFFPRLGLDGSVGHGTDWQGVFTSKNACGRIMVLATAVVLSQPKGPAHKILSLALFFFVMVMSGSRGAWVIEAMVLAIYGAFHIAARADARSRVLLLLSGVVVVVAAAAIGATHIAALAKVVGRDATLSGRTEIWKLVWPFIMERPILGWGYAGFFRGIQGESFRIVAAARFMVIHAHNGFLEMWLELGAAGLLIFAASYLRAWRKLWPRLRRGRMESVLWMLFVLLLIGLYDLDENTLLIYDGLFWVIYVAALVDIELLAVEEQLAIDVADLLAAVGESTACSPSSAVPA